MVHKCLAPCFVKSVHIHLVPLSWAFWVFCWVILLWVPGLKTYPAITGRILVTDDTILGFGLWESGHNHTLMGLHATCHATFFSFFFFLQILPELNSRLSTTHTGRDGFNYFSCNPRWLQCFYSSSPRCVGSLIYWLKEWMIIFLSIKLKFSICASCQ